MILQLTLKCIIWRHNYCAYMVDGKKAIVCQYCGQLLQINQPKEDSEKLESHMYH